MTDAMSVSLQRDGDTAARWNSHLPHSSRRVALAALLAQLEGAS